MIVVGNSIDAKRRRRAWLQRQHVTDPRCFYCLRVTVLPRQYSTGENCATVDHYVPRLLGGRDHASNWKLSCRLCNKLKGHMAPADWWAEIEAA